MFILLKGNHMFAIFNTHSDAGGDPSLLAEVCRRYRQQMFQYAMRLLHNENDAEDVVQEVFFAVAKSGTRSLAGAEKAGQLWPYLSAAVRNRCYNLLKKRGAELPLDQAVTEAMDRRVTGDSTEQAADYRLLVETIRSLPPEYADALYYALVLEMSSAEIARLLGLQPATARKRISRGRQLLRKQLGKEYAG